jgi:Uma2 family endonuclease
VRADLFRPAHFDYTPCNQASVARQPDVRSEDTAMATTRPRGLIAVTYEEAAREYLRNLPLEHFMEATAQAKQREITLESLAILKTRRPDLHVFNELLVQYPLEGKRKPGQVCPDNMVVISDQPPEAESSFNLPLESAAPFWVLEYVSKNNKRKDYEENFDKYERDLKVPYYLIFYPDNQELTLYRHSGKRYVSVNPNMSGRLPISELDVEVGLLDGWVRYWHKEELLPLPADLQRELDAAEQRAEEATHRAEQATRRADEASRLAAELEQRLQMEQDARLAVEQELAKLRAAMQQSSPRRNGPKGGA